MHEAIIGIGHDSKIRDEVEEGVCVIFIILTRKIHLCSLRSKDEAVKLSCFLIDLIESFTAFLVKGRAALREGAVLPLHLCHMLKNINCIFVNGMELFKNEKELLGDGTKLGQNIASETSGINFDLILIVKIIGRAHLGLGQVYLGKKQKDKKFPHGG